MKAYVLDKGFIRDYSTAKITLEEIRGFFEEDGEIYLIEGKDTQGNKGYALVQTLNKMPYDKGGYHATGIAVFHFGWGNFIDEYEDDLLVEEVECEN